MNTFYRLYTGSVLCLLLLVSTTAFAQQTVRGTVTDASDGTTLPGVTIRVKGTGTGTTTDLDGKYSIQIQSGNMLVFSSVGYLSQEIDPGQRSVIDVQLEPDVAQLSEVVVVGYGVQEKKDVTGSMSSLSSEDFNAGVINSPDQLFQGKLAGVNVTPAGGQPGGAVNITIRGASSIRSGNDPLYVIDGFPITNDQPNNGGVDEAGLGGSSPTNPLSFINPSDIESIDILKDASATAIYGSRGANGVIMITTKKGSQGKGSLTYNGYAGIDVLPRKIDLLTASEFVPAAVAAGASEASVNFGGTTDWQDEIFRTAYTHGHSVAFGGGSQASNYRISLSYLDQQGIVETNDFTRLTGRINASHSFLQDRVKLDFQMTAAQTGTNNVPISNTAGYQGNLIGAALQANPTVPVRDADGNFYQRNDVIGGATINSDFRNPMAMLEYITDSETVTRILGNVGATVNFTDELSYRINLGVDNGESVRRVFYDPRLSLGTSLDDNNGRATLYNRFISSTLVENYLNYNTQFGAVNFKALVGHSFQEFVNIGQRFSAINLPPSTDYIGYFNVDAGISPGGGNSPFDSDGNISQLQSFFGRVNFDISDKYLITATFRADGSTKFGANNAYGYFPSFAAAWRLSEETFVPEFFQDLKLRVGYGITGNQNIPSGLGSTNIQEDINTGDQTILFFGNPDIKWEQTQSINAGIDFGILEGRLSGSLDFFQNTTTDLLAQFVAAQPSPTTFIWENLDAEVINTGIEGSFDVVAVDNPNFRWDVNANFTYFLVNEVRDLGTFINTGEINGQGLTGAYAQRVQNGFPLYVFYMREFDGIAEDGSQMFANDGQLAFVGSPHPDVIYGLTNNFTIGNFSAGFTLNGVAGNQVYNNTANALFLRGALAAGRNVTEDVANSGEDILNAPIPSTRYLEDGSFLRLNNIRLGYNFDMSGTEAITALNFYVSGQNVFLIDSYSGFDPQVNTDKGLNGVPSLAIDYTGYPRSRSFQAGVNVRF